MKPFKDLSNIEKAILLLDLFPEEMQGLFIFSRATAEIIISDPEGFKASQVNLLHASGMWVDLARKVKTILDQHGDNMNGSNKMVTEQLYSKNNFLFAFHCMHQFIVSAKCMNKQFIKAVEMLFFFR